MRPALQTRRIEIAASSHLLLEPDPKAPRRYLVRFCGLHRDRAAQAATEHARVRLMMANLRGQAVYPYPLPSRMTIGAFDQRGWHCGRSEYAAALAAMPQVRQAIDALCNDLLLRIALSAGPSEPED